MPCLTISTNLQRSKIGEDFLLKVTTLLATLTGKPEKYITIHVQAGELMLFGGTDNPCAHVLMHSVGKIGLEENKGHTAAIMKLLEDELEISPERVYVFFQDVKRQDCGWNRTTFA